MYINDTYIGFYLLAAIVGLAVGQFVDWMNQRLQENKKVFSTDIFRKYKIEFKPNYILMLITATIYVGLVYKFGIQDSFIENLNLIKYIILTPMLLSVFVIDFKSRIIPNRLNLTMFEIGIVIAFLFGFSCIYRSGKNWLLDGIGLSVNMACVSNCLVLLWFYSSGFYNFQYGETVYFCWIYT